MNNYILAYYQDIQNGTENVNRWVRLMYEYIVKGLQSQSFFFDQKKANKAIRFVETFCHHCEGRDDLLKLELWQKAFVSVVFGVVGDNGFRQFREVVLIIARKNGKSLFAAAIIAYCAFCDGEYGAKIYCVAPKLDQADIVYSSFWQTIQKEPELAALIKRRKSDYYIESTNSSIKKIAFNAKKSDGFTVDMVKDGKAMQETECNALSSGYIRSYRTQGERSYMADCCKIAVENRINTTVLQQKNLGRQLYQWLGLFHIKYRKGRNPNV